MPVYSTGAGVYKGEVSVTGEITIRDFEPVPQFIWKDGKRHEVVEVSTFDDKGAGIRRFIAGLEYDGDESKG